MQPTGSPTNHEKPSAAARTRTIGLIVARALIILPLILIGGMKWTHNEALALQNWVSHSPILFWLYSIFSIDGASRAIGVVEFLIAGLLLARRFSPLAGLIGSLGAVGMFSTTLSFLITTPGAWTTGGGGLPTPTSESLFLFKDGFLLLLSLWSARESWDALRANRRANDTTAGKAMEAAR